MAQKEMWDMGVWEPDVSQSHAEQLMKEQQDLDWICAIHFIKGLGKV